MTLRSRRELLAGGLGVGAPPVLGGPPRAADLERDLRALEGLMAGEQLLQYAYTQVLVAQVLGRAANEVVLTAYGHEQAHATAVQSAITAVRHQLAGLPAAPQSGHPKPPQPFPPASVVKRFTHVRHETYAIVQLSHVEVFVQSKYFNGIAALSDPGLVRTTTEILACKAQTWSLYQDLLSHGRVVHTVPHASVRGSATLPR